jgi:hypothetical protein
MKTTTGRHECRTKCIASLDLAMRLPLEYFSTWAGRLKELTMTSDLFEGTWQANIDKSQWDPRNTRSRRASCERHAWGIASGYSARDGRP